MKAKNKNKKQAPKSNDRRGLVRIGFDVDKRTRAKLAAIQKRKGDISLQALFLNAVGIKIAA